jgi:hypothetical protein
VSAARENSEHPCPVQLSWLLCLILCLIVMEQQNVLGSSVGWRTDVGDEWTWADMSRPRLVAASFAWTVGEVSGRCVSPFAARRAHLIAALHGEGQSPIKHAIHEHPIHEHTIYEHTIPAR